MLHIVLVHPEIPHNTGAIGRLCTGLGARLHLVRPLGFRLTEKQIKRAGLDYWEHLDLRVHDSWKGFQTFGLDSATDASADAVRQRMFFMSTRGEKSLYDCVFQDESYLIFGSESRGFPEEIYTRHRDSLFKIPMPGENARSINLANAVAITAYEAYRQLI